MKRILGVALLLVFILTGTGTAFGQAAGTTTGGSVWGTVKDSTGAVLPGVTVKVDGPSLIASQVTVTNDRGIYRFPSLPPGEYTLTFDLPGFTALVREGIHLRLAFTATVDVEMTVSGVEETVTVTGESRVIDKVNTRQQTSFSLDTLESVPSGHDLWSTLGQAPAMQMSRIDVAGSAAGTQPSYRAYGAAGQNAPVVEGILALEGSSGTGWYWNYGSFEEISFGATSQSAEMANPGVQTVVISKSGGNEFTGSLYIDYANSKIQGSNIDDDQIAKGVRPGSNLMDKYNDVNADAGGYIMKDKLWWYGSVRRQEVAVNLPNFPFRPFATILPNQTGKLTYQLNSNNRIIGYVHAGRKRQPDRLRTLRLGDTGFYTDDKATWPQVNPALMAKIEWNRTIGDSAFLEVRAATWGVHTTSNRKTDAPHYEDLVTREVGGATYDWDTWHSRPQGSAALSLYKATQAGSHDIKLGFLYNKDQTRELFHDPYFPDNVVHILRNGQPAEVYHMAPNDGTDQMFWTGSYVRDTWTLDRLSVNVGIRWDRYRSAYPDQIRPESRFFERLETSADTNIVTWNVLAPRLGISWDVTGEGKNVFKSSYGRYYHNPSKTVVSAVNPNTFQQYRSYTWNDTNGDLLYQPGEEGSLLQTRGGAASAAIDPDLKDPYTDEFTLWFERELGDMFGLRTGLVYKRATRLFQTVNALNPPEAFNIPVTVVDPGADGVTGTGDDGTLNLFNLDPSLIGPTFTTIFNAPDYADTYWTWESTAQRRFSNRWSMYASLAITWRNDFESIPYTPNDPPQSNLLPMTFIKMGATVEPGWNMSLTPMFRFQTGEPFGRSLSARLNYGSRSVLAEPTDSRRRDGIPVLDIRVQRNFDFAGHRLGLFFDVANILNSNAEIDINTVTGSNFLVPATILPPRVLRIGTRFSW